MRAPQITEKKVLSQGFVKVQDNLYLKKVGLRRKYWARHSCGRFSKEPVDVKPGAVKLITNCMWCYDPERMEKPPRTEWDLTIAVIKVHKPELNADDLKIQ